MSEEEKTRGPGRPKMQIDYYEQVARMSGLGMSTEQIGYCFGMSKVAWHKRMNNDDKLKMAMHMGKANAIKKISEIAYTMAASGETPAMTMFWLKTQARWRENDSFNINFILQRFGVNSIKELTDEQLNTAIGLITEGGEGSGSTLTLTEGNKGS